MSTKGEPNEDAHTSNGISQAECAARLGITRQGVGQIERRALRKMRAAAEAEGLKLEDVLREVWR